MLRGQLLHALPSFGWMKVFCMLHSGLLAQLEPNDGTKRKLIERFCNRQQERAEGSCALH